MAGLKHSTSNRAGRRRRLVAATAAGVILAVSSSSVAIGEGMVGIGMTGAEGTYVAVSPSGYASSSQGVAVAPNGDATGGLVGLSGVGYASGSAASVSGTGAASRDSLVTSNVVSPGTIIGVGDNVTYVYGGTTVDTYIGAYAEAAVRAREQVGIIDTVHELTTTQDDAVRTLIDQILVNPVQGATQATIDYLNSHVDGAEAAVIGLTSCPPTLVCRSSYGGDSWDSLNPEEQKVCRNNPYDCKRSEKTQPDAESWTRLRFGRNGHNDRSDAFRHCFWSALMTKRANEDFSRRFGDAHEYGDKKQPRSERDMDLHNNSVGRGYGRYERSDTFIANACETAVREHSLVWLKG